MPMPAGSDSDSSCRGCKKDLLLLGDKPGGSSGEGVGSGVWMAGGAGAV